MYKDDVGVVEKVISSDEIFIRLIPRLDPSGFKMNKSKKEKPKKFNRF